MASFSIKESFSYGWEVLQKHFWPMVGITAAIMAISAIFSSISSSLIAANQGSAAAILNAIEFLVNVYIGAGILQLAFKFYDGEEVKAQDFKVQGKTYVSMLLAMIFFALIVAAGFILLVIPGFIWLVTYYFYAYLVVDKGIGAREAIHQSRLITKGDRWRIAGLLVLAILLNLAGMLALFVGLLVTVPMTVMAYVYVYRKLASKLEPAQPAPVAPEIPEAPVA